jgi:hypothetical protein
MENTELWHLYHLEKYYFENGIEKDHPARAEVDFFLEAFADMFQRDEEQKQAGTLTGEDEEL